MLRKKPRKIAGCTTGSSPWFWNETAVFPQHALASGSRVCSVVSGLDEPRDLQQILSPLILAPPHQRSLFFRIPIRGSFDRKEYLEVVATLSTGPCATPTARKSDAKGNDEGLNCLPGGDRSNPGGFVSPSCVGKFLSPAHLRSRASPLSSRARSRVTPPYQATTPETPVRLSRTPQSESRQASPHTRRAYITPPPVAHVKLPVTPPGSECDVGDDKNLGDDKSPDPETKPIRECGESSDEEVGGPKRSKLWMFYCGVSLNTRNALKCPFC